MIFNGSKQRRSSSWRLLLGLLCLALVVLGSTIQVAHTHANGDLSHADCPLCATAHVVAQIVASPVPVAAVLIVAQVPADPQLPSAVKPSVFALYTRPPPSVSTLA